jgi:hypothetical protein
VIPTDYREFFVATAGATGALIGLLFVAISVFPERLRQPDTRVESHARASAALLLFSNSLVLSLAALVPAVSLGWWATVISVVVFAFAAATARSIAAAARHRRARWRSFGLVIALLVISGFELYAGVELIGDRADRSAIQTLDYVIMGSLSVGIARAWQLVGMRDTGLISSLRVVAHGDDLAPGDDGKSDARRTEPPHDR